MAGYGSGTVPSGFCTAGFSSLYAAFIVSLLIDLVFQVTFYYFKGLARLFVLTASLKQSLCLDVYALFELEVFQTPGTLPRDEGALFRRYVEGPKDRGFLFFHDLGASGQID